MKFEKVLKGGTIYNGDSTFVSDIGINGESIVALGVGLESDEMVIIRPHSVGDAAGLGNRQATFARLDAAA